MSGTLNWDDEDRRNQAFERIARAISQAPLVREEDINVIVEAGIIKSNGELRTELRPSELDVLRLIGNGLRDSDIAEELNRSIYTIKTHIKTIYYITGCKNRYELYDLGKELGKKVDDND